MLDALHADLEELRSPDDGPAPHRPGCPVTASACCLVRLVRGNAEVARAEGKEVYTQREVRLLNRLARFMRDATPERVRSIEMLVEELIEKA